MATRSKPIPAYGTHAAWALARPGERRALEYHQLVPQMYHPVDAVLPLIAALAALPRPAAIGDLPNPLVVPVVPAPVSFVPRFESAAAYRAAGHGPVDRAPAPPCDPVQYFDALAWLYWDDLCVGPYVKSRYNSRARAVRGKPAFRWEVIDTGAGLEVGFTAYDQNGLPAPWLEIAPLPLAEFGAVLRADDTLAALAGL